MKKAHISNSFDGEEYVVLLAQGMGALTESPTKIRLLKFTPELNLEIRCEQCNANNWELGATGFVRYDV